MKDINSCFNCGTRLFEDDSKGIASDRFQVHCEICGNYILSDTAAVIRNMIPQQKRWVLSAWIQEQNRRGHVPVLDSKYYDTIYSHIHEPTVDEKLDRAILLIGARSQFGGDEVTAKIDTDYANFWSTNPDEMMWIGLELQKLEYIDSSRSAMGHLNAVLTGRGWSRFHQLTQLSVDSAQVFVAMWFADELEDVYEHGFRAAIENDQVGYTALRIDKKEHSNKIDDEIVLEIRRSRAVVADFTGHRGGVYFEAGFALGLGKPVIWTCRKSDLEETHFDTRQYNHIVWKSADDLRVQLSNRILALGI
jgi:nucleoside 2-deoxyribosyltransferase